MSSKEIYQVKYHASDSWHEVSKEEYDTYGPHGKRVLYTRPAPVATDTGLETLGFVYPTFITERERGYDEIFRTVRVPENWEPVVTRSQAEAIIAAKDARIKELEELCNDTEAEALGCASDKAELEAKLAAAEKALEPFALISSEGVIKQETGHVTVITCAEYFHNARAVLGGKTS